MNRLIAIYLTTCTLLLTSSCRKEEPESQELILVNTYCDLPDLTIEVRNKKGTLTYNDPNQVLTQHLQGYFIVDHEVSEMGNLPLKICNFPVEKFPQLEDGESLDVIFDGRIVRLPYHINAAATTLELSAIRR